jgi:hypothetical protein
MYASVESARQSRFAAKAARQQAEIAERDQRPWIAAPDIQAKVENSVVSFIWKFKNVGRSPTRGFHIDGKLIDGKLGNGEAWKKELDDLCEDGRRVAREQPQDFNLFVSIPQGDFILTKMPYDHVTVIPLQDLKKLQKNGGPGLLGCVTYRDQWVDTLHKTGFIAPLTIKGDNVKVEAIYAVKAD